MLPRMPIKVYQTNGYSNGFYHRITQRLRLADKSNDKAIMIFVITVIEQFHSCPATKGGYYLIYFLQIPTFAEIRNAFYYFIPVHNFFFIGFFLNNFFFY